jgi:predicted NBD/HSP70 family sugar kinase
MPKSVGVLVMEHIAVGLVENNKLAGPLNLYPEKGASLDALQAMPASDIGDCIQAQIDSVAKGQKIQAVGLGFPGVIRGGVIEDSPNLHQVKGFNMQAALSRPGSGVAVRVFNDADAMAAGVAATHGKLQTLIRVWTLGNGVGFGRYPWSEGVWEGGHSVVTLDPKENLCGCGGRGHLEGILGQRSMRMRFLDLEPDEVFANARSGDARCAEFVTLCHRALAAATATSIHMDGPGQFYITGPNAKYIDIALLDRFVHEMVRMSPLQGSRFEVIPTSDDVGVIGAALNAERFAHAAP